MEVPHKHSKESWRGKKWNGADEQQAADTIKYNETDIDRICQLLFTWETLQHRTNRERLTGGLITIHALSQLSSLPQWG